MSDPTLEEQIAFAKDALDVFTRLQREVRALEDRHPALPRQDLADEWDELIDELKLMAER